MVTLIRVEAEGPALTNVAKDLDRLAAEFAKATGDSLRVHDEHYERVHDTMFKGRRVYRIGEKSVRTVVAASTDYTSGSGGVTFSLAS